MPPKKLTELDEALPTTVCWLEGPSKTGLQYNPSQQLGLGY